MGIWLPEARKVLIEAARDGSVVRYRRFVDLVEARSGLPGEGYSEWMHTTLQRLAELCLEGGEPILSALCVNRDGTVAGGFAQALEKFGYGKVEVEDLAALERRKCYLHYELEATGRARNAGQVQMTEQKKPLTTDTLMMCPRCLKLIHVTRHGRFANHLKKGGIPCPGSAAPPSRR